jgi:hypothetical protein
VTASVHMLSKVKNVSKEYAACIFRVEKYLAEVISKKEAFRLLLTAFFFLLFDHEVIPKNL